MSRILPTRARSRAPAARGRRDLRWLVALATVLSIAVVGIALQTPGSTDADADGGRIDGRTAPALHAVQARNSEVQVRFEQAVVMLHARQYSHAVAALHRVIELEPAMPEAHVNMGYALLGLGQARQARDFFEGATALRPAQANAYFGLAMALEAGGDMPAAIGAMRTFVHLSAPDDPFVRKARAALWEWQEARLSDRSGTAASR